MIPHSPRRRTQRDDFRMRCRIAPGDRAIARARQDVFSARDHCADGHLALFRRSPSLR
jgi:hypothetical protein